MAQINMAQANISQLDIAARVERARAQRKEFRIYSTHSQPLRLSALEMSIEGEIVKLADVDSEGKWTIIYAGHLRNTHIFTNSTQKEGQ